jgi:hypothetical protein
MDDINIFQMSMDYFSHTECLQGLNLYMVKLHNMKAIHFTRKSMIINRYNKFIILWNKYVQIYTSAAEFLTYRLDSSFIPQFDEYLCSQYELRYSYWKFTQKTRETKLTRQFENLYNEMASLFRIIH